MIILRQKEYSTPIGRFMAGINKNILRRPKIKSYRNAISTENKVLSKVAKGMNDLKRTYYFPGNSINRGVEKIIENPVSAGGVILGKVTDVTNPETIAIPKATIAAMLGDKVLPKVAKERLKRVSRGYEKSKVAETIENLPSLPDVARGLGVF